MPLRSRLSTLLRPALAALTALALPHVAVPAAQAATERAPLRSAAVPQESAETARVIVRFRATRLASTLSANRSSGTATTAALHQAQALGQRLGLSLQDGTSIAPDTQVILASGMNSAALASRLAADSQVAEVHVDQRRRAHAVVSDPLYAGGSGISPASGQWYLHTPTSTLVSSINAESAWSLTTGSAGVIVAVLDTGIRWNHPDLDGKLVAGYDFVSESVISNDGDGWDSNPADPGDWISASENSSNATLKGCGVADSSWHGTQTAGLIAAATNNATGMAGLGRHVRVMPVRVLGKCGGYDSDIIAGMRWAAGLTVPGVPANPNPARVINMSLGYAGSCSSSDPYTVAVAEINAAGTVVVASVGNDSLAVNTPANCAGVIAVAGLRHTGTKNGYSSLGSQATIAAPAGNCVNATGECLYPILSTSNTGTTAPACPTYTTGGSDAAVGTSFSAPLVSGTAALMLAANPALTPAQVTALLKSSARSFPSSGATGVSTCVAGSSSAQDECYCTTGTCGAGMLDAGAAVRAAAGTLPIARIGETTTRIALGSATLLDGSGSSATGSRTLAGYGWSLSDSALAAFNGTTSGSTASVSATGSGLVAVTLTVGDSAGGSASSSAVLRTGPAPTAACGTDGSDSAGTPASGGGSTSSGDGGGALGAGWLGGLGLAVAALARLRRREARAA
ncbi:S8 family peptidase [Sphaerotilus uruguayifluvii]|uniref:Serine protease n=1 Tax=Sphaerotilus uruguayifluvii TaxID=2735897 RepID=A0ABX2G6F6_9BURK|nr:S8 family peptidase [Leptothrix sp. C29]NRT57913.1 serine protease [Leptothrix sp. C29]